MRRVRSPRWSGWLLALLATAACGLGDFEAESKLTKVRILASRADKPYAKPGDTVNLEVLAFDGRVDKSRPMQIYWIPFPCINPPNDLYYLCFSLLQSAQAGGSGAGSPASILKPGVDLTPFLPTGPSFSFKLPDNIVESHPPVEGTKYRYGLAVVFNVACAGHLEIVPLDPNDLRKQKVPLGCFDENHDAVGPDDYVIGLTRVYGYDTLTNANPTIGQVTFQGQPVDLGEGIVVDHCTTQRRRDCPELKVDVKVPDAAWQVADGVTNADEQTLHEEIWVDYYGSIGDFDGGARLLFDTKAGRIDDTPDKYRAPRDPGTGWIFAVVHDNRGGATWTKFPVYVK